MAFADIPVSTQTYTVRSNIRYIDLQRFYEELVPMDPPGGVNRGVNRGAHEEAAIICIKYQQHKKGCDPVKDLKTKRKRTTLKDSSKRNFLNCITLIIQIEKRINIKIFKNGVFQLTGCKNIDNVRRCLKLILTELSRANERVLSQPISDAEQPVCFHLEEGFDGFVIYAKSAMRNIDFGLGFKVDRALLANMLTYIYKDDDSVIIPDAIGNKMDVKIKLRITREELEHLPVTKITNPTHDEPIEEEILYKKCLHIIEHDTKKIESKMRDKFVSFSIFQNGKVLLSAMDETIQKKYYEWFINLISEIKEAIKQTVLPKKTFLVGKSRPKIKFVI